MFYYLLYVVSYDKHSIGMPDDSNDDQLEKDMYYACEGFKIIAITDLVT